MTRYYKIYRPSDKRLKDRQKSLREIRREFPEMFLDETLFEEFYDGMKQNVGISAEAEMAALGKSDMFDGLGIGCSPKKGDVLVTLDHEGDEAWYCDEDGCHRIPEFLSMWNDRKTLYRITFDHYAEHVLIEETTDYGAVLDVMADRLLANKCDGVFGSEEEYMDAPDLYVRCGNEGKPLYTGGNLMIMPIAECVVTEMAEEILVRPNESTAMYMKFTEHPVREAVLCRDGDRTLLKYFCGTGYEEQELCTAFSDTGDNAEETIYRAAKIAACKKGVSR